MLLFFAAYGLSLAWPYVTVGPPAPRDVNGVLITVGATVKLVGTVTSVNAVDGHGLGITFQPVNPSSGSVTAILPQQANFLMPTSPLPGKPVFKADPSQLVVGS